MDTKLDTMELLAECRKLRADKMKLVEALEIALPFITSAQLQSHNNFEKTVTRGYAITNARAVLAKAGAS